MMFTRLFDRPFNNQRGLWKLLPNINVRRLSPNCIGRDHHAFYQLMRVLVQNVAIFKSPGLGLVAIAD